MITEFCNVNCGCFRSLNEDNVYYCAALGKIVIPEQRCLIKTDNDL